MNSKKFKAAASTVIAGRFYWAIGVSFVLMGLFFSTTTKIQAADGDLDVTFGNGGKVLVDFSATSEYGRSVVVQPDGKIIVAGQSGTYPLFHSALVRFNANGTLDESFGVGGKALLPLDPNGDGLSSVALQPDGRIVVAGSQIHDNFTVGLLVARCNSNGSLDQTFGNGGSVLFSFGDSGSQGNAVVVQADGKIIVVGQTGASYGELVDIAIARFNSDGAFDNTYGANGKTRTHFPGQFNTGSRATSAALQTDGKLVVAGGYKNEGTPGEFALARYETSGKLDPTFGAGGIVHTSLGSAESTAMSVGVQTDGRIVAAGYFYTAHRNKDFALARYNANGTLDVSFGKGGIIISDLFGTSDDIAYGLCIQRDNKLVVIGRSGMYPNFRAAVVRYNRSGSFDSGFGMAGKVMTDFGSLSSQFYGAALQPDGKIVVAGYSSASTSDIAVARYIARTIRLSSSTTAGD